MNNFKLIILLIFAILVISSPQFNQEAFAAILFDSSNSIVCSTNPCSLPITVASGSDRMITVVSTEENTLNPVTAIDITGGTSQGILVGTVQVGSADISNVVIKPSSPLPAYASANVSASTCTRELYSP